MDSDILYQKLLDASFRLVSFRPRSVKELREFIKKKMRTWKVVDQKMLESVMERLSELGYADDEKFTTWWVDQRHKNKPKGQRSIRQELRMKGIDTEIVEKNLGTEQKTEKDLALQAVHKKMLIWCKLSPLDQKRKLYSFLLRQGFDSQIAYSVIDEVCH